MLEINISRHDNTKRPPIKDSDVAYIMWLYISGQSIEIGDVLYAIDDVVPYK